MRNNFVKSILEAPIGSTHIFNVGQAGFIIKSPTGQLLGIDLYLSDSVEYLEGHDGFKRLLPKILYPEDLEFNILISTHFHYDHFDADSIPALINNSHCSFFAAFDCKKEIEKLGLNEPNIRYVKANDIIEKGDFKIKFVCCDHGTATPDAIGALINVSGKNILETGDTCLRLDWIDNYLSFGKLDLLIAPINGAYGNLNEKECSLLAEKLQPKQTIPCHYGMFASHGGNPGIFREYMIEKKLNYRLMAFGEKITL